jgi:hypothetical protein
LPLEEFIADYEASRLFGFGIAIFARPLFANEKAIPEKNQALSTEKFDAVMLTDHSGNAERMLDTNPRFKQVLTEIIEELIPYLDKRGYVK